MLASVWTHLYLKKGCASARLLCIRRISAAGMARSLAGSSEMSSMSMATCEMLTSGNQKMGSNTLVALLKGDSSRLLHLPTPCPPYKNLQVLLFVTLLWYCCQCWTPSLYL